MAALRMDRDIGRCAGVQRGGAEIRDCSEIRETTELCGGNDACGGRVNWKWCRILRDGNDHGHGNRNGNEHGRRERTSGYLCRLHQLTDLHDSLPRPETTSRPPITAVSSSKFVPILWVSIVILCEINIRLTRSNHSAFVPRLLSGERMLQHNMARYLKSALLRPFRASHNSPNKAA